MRNVKSTLMYKWFSEVWNNDNEHAIDKLMAGDAIAEGILTEDMPKGTEGFKIFFRNFRSQFHNIQVTVDDVVSEDDMEAARTTVHMIHTSSGKPVSFTGTGMCRVKDGKIAAAWNNYDFLGLYQQLGQKLV